jgi:hypothetical protein
LGHEHRDLRQLRARWQSELDPSLYQRTPDDSYPGASVPVVGRHLMSWCVGISDGYRKWYARHFTAAVRSEAIARGYGGYFRGFTRDQVQDLFVWAKAYLYELDDAERLKQAERGPYKPKAIERPR